MVTKNISFYDIQAFLALIYNNILWDELAEYLDPGTYKFPNGKFEWGHSIGTTRVSIQVNVTNDHVAFIWPPLQNEGILLETSSNGFQLQIEEEAIFALTLIVKLDAWVVLVFLLMLLLL